MHAIATLNTCRWGAFAHHVRPGGMVEASGRYHALGCACAVHT